MNERRREDKADVKHELKVFPGTQHGFCFPERAVYDTLAAEETWSEIFAMWDRRRSDMRAVENPAHQREA